MKAQPPIQWTIMAAQKEFGANRETITTRLSQEGEKPDEDGCYTTGQIVKALFNDMRAEKIGLTRAQRLEKEIKNRTTLGELIDVRDVVEWVGRFTYAARQRIILSPIPDAEKNKILDDLQRLAKADPKAALTQNPDVLDKDGV